MSQRRLPPLNAVRAFEAAARLGSYVAAADELHVTQPAIGRHVKALEERLNCALFDRTPRGVVLTDEGRRYYEQIHHALEIIGDASEELTARGKTRWLRLRVVPGFASRFLSAHLADFRAHYPAIRLALEPNASFSSIDPEQTDLGIVYGDQREFSGELEELIRPAIFPVCSPEFLRKNDELKQPQDLLKLPLLHEDDGTWWNTWLRSNGVKSKTMSEVSYASADQILSLAVAGQGVALTNNLLAQRELQSGQLVRVLNNDCVLDAYYLLTANKAQNADVKAFRHWLIKTIADHQKV